MTKKKIVREVKEDTALLSFKNEAQKKLYALIAIDLAILAGIIIIVPNIIFALALSSPIMYLLIKHLVGYNKSTKKKKVQT